MNVSPLPALPVQSVAVAPVRTTQAPVIADPSQTTLPPVYEGSAALGSARSPDEQGRAQREQSQAEQLRAQQEQEAQEARARDQQEAEQQRIDQQEISRLSARDAEVRAHEQAHAAVGGQYAGAPSYTFKRGPDGRSYAVAGEVSIDASPVNGDPEATLAKMQQVLRAALAPAEPSSADLRIAAQAQAALTEARAELAEKNRNEQVQAQEQREADRLAAEEDDQQRQQDREQSERLTRSPFDLTLYRRLSALSPAEGVGFSAEA